MTGRPLFCKIVVATQQNYKTGGLPVKPILPHVLENDDTLCSAAYFFSRFRIGELFRKTARSGKGIPAFKVLQFLFALVFLKKGFYEMMKEESLPWGKDVFYRFLSSNRINWRRFLLLVAKRLLDVFFLPLTSRKEERVFILDDSNYSRNRSKNVELLSKCYDHSAHSHFKGFQMLTLGWSDGRSFLPLLFTLLGSAKEENRLCDARSSDGRTSRGGQKAPERNTPGLRLICVVFSFYPLLRSRARGASIRSKAKRLPPPAEHPPPPPLPPPTSTSKAPMS